MSDSLKDQLLKLGFKSAPPPRQQPNAKSDKPGHKPGKPRHRGQPSGPARKDQRSREEIDLARAYAIRAQKEKDERIAAEKQRQEEARIRRENKTKLLELLGKASLNVADAEIARHFEYGGKIRRVYVTQEQLRAINAGELAVVQHAGRYSILSLEDADAAQQLMPGCLALKVDPNAPPSDTDYSDPKFQVPDDLVW
jgi:uncharacterized protein YaiL (DUF2058 family)